MLTEMIILLIFIGVYSGATMAILGFWYGEKFIGIIGTILLILCILIFFCIVYIDIKRIDNLLYRLENLSIFLKYLV